MMSTGCFGVTVSSSASVGMRGAAGGGVNWLMLKPPRAVIQSVCFLMVLMAAWHG